MRTKLLFAVVVLSLVTVTCGEPTSPSESDAVATVSVAPGDRDLMIGESVEFSATLRSATNRILTGRTITWSVLDELVASVDAEGLVTGLRAGTTKLTATSEGKTGTATVRVDAPGPAPVSTIELSPDGLELLVGQSFQLTAILRSATGQVLLDRSVTWASKSESVLTVSPSGMVTGVTAGVAEISATSEGKEGLLEVSVIEDPDAGRVVSSVVVEPSALDLAEGDSETLEARAFDADGAEITGRAILWSVADGQRAIVDGGTVTGLKPGETTVGVRIDGVTTYVPVRISADYSHDLLYDAWEGVPGVGPELFSLDLRDSVPDPVRPFPTGRVARDPAPSPDGSRIAFVVPVGSSSQIYVTNRDGSGLVVLTSGSGFHDQPAWSPDGTRIAFRTWPEGEDSDIWSVDVASGAATNLTDELGDTNQYNPAWSPDASRIVYGHVEGLVGQLRTMRSDGTDHAVLTSSPLSYDHQPAWSPDGTTIAFVRYRDFFGAELWLVQPGGSERELVALAGPQFAPAWSPDGRPVIGFVSRHDGQGNYDAYTVWSDGSRVARRTDGTVDIQNVTWIRRP